MKSLPIASLLAAPALALAASLALPASALAQTARSGTDIAPGNTLLSVTGEGQSMRQPDIAVFNAGVATTGKTAGEALSANSAAMNRVIAALKRAGIAERDVQTSNLNLEPVYQQYQQPRGNELDQQMPQIIGYRASNNVTVKQRKLAEFGRVIDTLVSAGANSVSGPGFQLDDSSAALDEARLEAMKKARARAELYATAAGLRVARIISISESGGYMPSPQMMYARVAMAEAAAPTPVSPGEVAMSINVSVQFELTP
jgi:uncharacterized protein